MPDARVYDADEVDRYVAQLQHHVAELQGEVAALRHQLSQSAMAGRDEAAERALGRAMIQAQLAADQATEDAAKEAERIIDDAHRARREILQQAQQEQDRILSGVRRGAEHTDGDYAAQRTSYGASPYSGPVPAPGGSDLLGRPPPPPPWANPAPSPSASGPDEPFRPAPQNAVRADESAGPPRGVPFLAPPPTGRPVLSADPTYPEPPAGGSGNHRG